MREQEEKELTKKVNDVCVKEWEKRLKAKRHLDLIKENTRVHDHNVL